MALRYVRGRCVFLILYSCNWRQCTPASNWRLNSWFPDSTTGWDIYVQRWPSWGISKNFPITPWSVCTYGMSLQSSRLGTIISSRSEKEDTSALQFVLSSTVEMCRRWWVWHYLAGIQGVELGMVLPPSVAVEEIWFRNGTFARSSECYLKLNRREVPPKWSG